VTSSTGIVLPALSESPSFNSSIGISGGTFYTTFFVEDWFGFHLHELIGIFSRDFRLIIISADFLSWTAISKDPSR
jgi:hypothetical protein